MQDTVYLYTMLNAIQKTSIMQEQTQQIETIIEIIIKLQQANDTLRKNLREAESRPSDQVNYVVRLGAFATAREVSPYKYEACYDNSIPAQRFTKDMAQQIARLTWRDGSGSRFTPEVVHFTHWYAEQIQGNQDTIDFLTSQNQ